MGEARFGDTKTDESDSYVPVPSHLARDIEEWIAVRRLSGALDAQIIGSLGGRKAAGANRKTFEGRFETPAPPTRPPANKM